MSVESAASHQSRTPGGAKLRQLRERAGMTQLQVELEAELGTGYLQRLESGRVQQPVRATLERILNALGARFSERREVLEVFGYMVGVTLPDAGEQAWAISVALPELDRFPFPAYLLDCGNRLIRWNQEFPRLLGENGESLVRDRLTAGAFVAAWFDRTSPLTERIVDPEESCPALMRAFRHEMGQFQHADWFPELLTQLLNLELFRHYWDLAEQADVPAAAARALVPLRLRAPDGDQLRFRLSAEQFTRDSRFRIIYYFPSDSATMAVCERWRHESGQAIGPT